MFKKFKVALALGGGGVRGLAHLGIIKVLEAERICLDLIAGTSMGAVIGGAYAVNPHIPTLETKILELLKEKDILELEKFAADTAVEEKHILVKQLKHSKQGVVDSETNRPFIEELVGKNTNFCDTQIPFACVTTDLKSGEEVVFNKGKLSDAILASCSLAGAFTPVKLNNRLLIDGGVMSEVPVEAARRLGGDFVIGVGVHSANLQQEFRHGMDIIFQADIIRTQELERVKLRRADFVISPELENISWAHFSKGKFCIEQGRLKAKRLLKDLKRQISRAQCR